MRRTLIFILLGIICYSTITSMQSSLSSQESFRLIIDTVRGSVSAGNFTYWTLGQKGPLLIELTTLEGDADLFISDNPRPSFEADKNNFSSETCGVDFAYIPVEFPRPIGIGVFGHWSSPYSEFAIQVYLDVVSPPQQTTIWNLPKVPKVHSTVNNGDDSLGAVKDSNKHEEASSDGDSDVESKPTSLFGGMDEKHRFLQLFKVLDTVFELFAL